MADLTFKQLGIDVDGNALKISNLLNTPNVTGAKVDSYAEISALVVSYKLIQEAADAARGNEEKLPEKSDYQTIGINFAPLGSDELDQAVITLLSDVIDGLNLEHVATQQQVQTLVSQVEIIMRVAAPGGEVDTSGLNVALFDDLGFSGVNANNLITVAGKVANSNSNGSGVDQFTEIQNMINAVVPEALARIKTYCDGGDVTAGRLVIQDFLDIDISTVTTENLAAVNNKVFAAGSGEVNNIVKVEGTVQSAITAYQEGLEALKGAVNSDNTASITASTYADVGLINVDIDNYQYITPFLLNSNVDSTKVETFAAVKAFADAVLKIRSAADEGGTSPILLEFADFTALGIFVADDETGINLLNSVINEMPIERVDTPADVTDLAHRVNAVIWATADGPNSNVLTYTHLNDLGLSGANTFNFVTIKTLIFVTVDSGSAVDSLTKLATLIVDMQADAINSIEMYSQSDPNLAVQVYWDAGATNVNSDNITVVNAEILAAEDGAANSLVNIQTIVDVAISMVDALEAIKNRAESNDAITHSLQLSDYADAKVKNVSAVTLAAINSLLDSQLVNGDAMNSKLEIQQLVDNYNVILASADGIDDADPQLSMVDYQLLGLKNVESAGRAKLLNSVFDQKNTDEDVNNYTELQAIADAADRVFDYAKDTTGTMGLGIADLAALGVTNVDNNNIQQIRARLMANLADEKIYDTLGALQQIVDQEFSITVSGFTGTINSQGDYGSIYDTESEVKAIGDTGAYLLAWRDSGKINIQRFEADGSGSSQGIVTLAADNVTDHKPNIAILNDSGDFVISWFNEDGNIYFSAYSDMVVTDPKFPIMINILTDNGSTYELDMAVINATGTSVVVWQGGSTVYSCTLASNGTIKGETGAKTDSGTYYVKVASAGDDGSYIITASQYVNGKSQILVQKINADGSSQPKVYLDTDTNNQYADQYSSISMLGNSGDFVVAFSGGSGTGSQVYTQKFNSDGLKQDGLLALDVPSGAMSVDNTAISEIGTSGEYVVVWEAWGADSVYEIYSQKVNANGTTTGNELIRFNSNSEILHDQGPSVSEIGSGGDYVISWNGRLPDGSTHVYTQRVSSEGQFLTTWIGDGDIDITTALEGGLEATSYRVVYTQGLLVAKNNKEYPVESTDPADSNYNTVVVPAADWLDVKLIGITDAQTYELTITVTGTSIIDGTTITITTQPYDMSTPLILDLNNNGIETLSVDEGIIFDIDADGSVDHTGWVGKNDGLLVRDLNGDGMINDATELFGEHTLLADGTKAQDGYAALAALDSNGDGLINAADDTFTELQVWVDANSDGITQAGELLSLQQAGVSEITLTYQHSNIDSNGNTIGMLGSYTNNSGEQQQMGDVWFKYQAGALTTGSLAATASANSTQLNIDSSVIEPAIQDDLNVPAAQAVSVKAQLLAEYASLFAEFTSLAAKAALQPSAIVTEYLGADPSGNAVNSPGAEGQIKAASHLFPLLEPSGDPADERELWLTPAQIEDLTLDDVLADVEGLSAAIDNLYKANSSAELFEGLTDSQQGTLLEMATFSISENSEDLITIPRSHNDYE